MDNIATNCSKPQTSAGKTANKAVRLTTLVENKATRLTGLSDNVTTLFANCPQTSWCAHIV
jgi:hypothetical protein